MMRHTRGDVHLTVGQMDLELRKEMQLWDHQNRVLKNKLIQFLRSNLSIAIKSLVQPLHF